ALSLRQSTVRDARRGENRPRIAGFARCRRGRRATEAPLEFHCRECRRLRPAAPALRTLARRISPHPILEARPGKTGPHDVLKRGERSCAIGRAAPALTTRWRRAQPLGGESTPPTGRP